MVTWLLGAALGVGLALTVSLSGGTAQAEWSGDGKADILVRNTMAF